MDGTSVQLVALPTHAVCLLGGGGYWKKCGEDVLRCRCFCLHIMTQTFGHRVLKEVSTILFSQSFFFP